jgi:hypothetical protein
MPPKQKTKMQPYSHAVGDRWQFWKGLLVGSLTALAVVVAGLGVAGFDFDHVRSDMQSLFTLLIRR